MPHEIVDQLLNRAEREKSESDFAYFFSLLVAGEALAKTITLGMLAAIEDDTEKNRYRIEYRLVRATGLGDWHDSLVDVVSGPASTHIAPGARIERNELTKKMPKGVWQDEAVRSLTACLDSLTIQHDDLSAQTDLLTWFRLFASLRNHTRGHGATLAQESTRASVQLATSIQTISQNFHLFQRSWVYLNRNLSGKYRVTPISHASPCFDPYKSDSHHSLNNGIYIDYDSPRLVPLIVSDPDLTDFFLPNANFSDHSYDLMSYATSNRMAGDSTRYLTPPNARESETQGYPELKIKGNCFSNAPEPREDYVNRDEYEDNLFELLVDHRRRVVTLQGAGGIGKTSLALQVIDRLSSLDRFDMLAWFSARDIDLLPTGPKTARPGFLSKNDIAKQYCRFVLPPDEIPSRPTDLQSFFQEQLAASDGGKCLFVFDNFETVQDRLDMFNWIERSVTPPNKVLITTRLRDFKGDYPLEVRGMSHAEARALISQTALRLKILPLLNEPYVEDLIQKSEGHPYFIKIVLGEVAAKRRLISPKNIVAASSDILAALFERTFDALSPCARRAFLTLSAWKSAVPRVALEAVLMQSTGLRSEVENSVDSLLDYSLAESRRTSEDSQEFIALTLAAHLFGNSLLQINPDKSSIFQDVSILQMFTPSSISDVNLDMGRIFTGFIKNVSDRVDQGGKITDYEHILDMVCRSFNPGRLQLAQWRIERDSDADLDAAIDYINSYIQNDTDGVELADAWRLLARAYYLNGNLMGEMHAWVERSQLEEVPFFDISRTANYINHKFNELEIRSGIDVLADQMLQIMDSRSEEASADDFSRMAWLAINTQQEARAKKLVERGLQKDTENLHCIRIANRFGISV